MIGVVTRAEEGGRDGKEKEPDGCGDAAGGVQAAEMVDLTEAPADGEGKTGAGGDGELE